LKPKIQFRNQDDVFFQHFREITKYMSCHNLKWRTASFLLELSIDMWIIFGSFFFICLRYIYFVVQTKRECIIANYFLSTRANNASVNRLWITCCPKSEGRSGCETSCIYTCLRCSTTSWLTQHLLGQHCQRSHQSSWVLCSADVDHLPTFFTCSMHYEPVTAV
jgi:hypothetical protein